MARSHLLLLDSGQFWQSWICNQFVHSWTRLMMSRWLPRPARFSLASAESKNELCSPTMSCSPPIAIGNLHGVQPVLSLHQPTYLGTPGIVIYLCLPWTSGGKTTLETLSLFVRRTGLWTYLHEYRPHWTEGQEHNIARSLPNDIQAFTSHIQPYIMRHELPWGSF